MSIQSEISRITNERDIQTNLIEQAIAALEGKAGGSGSSGSGSDLDGVIETGTYTPISNAAELIISHGLGRVPTAVALYCASAGSSSFGIKWVVGPVGTISEQGEYVYFSDCAVVTGTNSIRYGTDSTNGIYVRVSSTSIEVSVTDGGSMQFFTREYRWVVW